MPWYIFSVHSHLASSAVVLQFLASPFSFQYSVCLSCLAIFCLTIGQINFTYQPMTAAQIYSVQKDIPQQVYTDCPLCVICGFHLIIFSKLIVCIYHFLLLLVLKFRLIWGNLTCHEAVWLIITCFQVFSVHHCIVQILNNGQHWVSGSSWRRWHAPESQHWDAEY